MECETVFSAAEPFFKGHYPGQPVTPGVMLIDRAVAETGRLRGRSIALKAIKKVKFSNPVFPDETVLLKLEPRGDGEMSYLFSKNGTACACGILVF